MSSAVSQLLLRDKDCAEWIHGTNHGNGDLFYYPGLGASRGLFGILIQTSAGNSGLAKNQLWPAVAERLVGEPEDFTRSEIKNCSPKHRRSGFQMLLWS
jgi:hypothetical protein